LSVELALAYSTKIPDIDLAGFDSLLNQSQDLVLSFASSDTVRNFCTLLGQQRLSKLDLPVLSIGPRTTQTIRELLPSLSVIEAKQSSFESMLDAIIDINVKA
jgi:uroporphyrinogen-III synthase